MIFKHAMFQWASILLRLQIGVALVIALPLSIVPLAGSVFGAGRQIAFESDRDGNWEIYLMDVDRQIVHNLTRNPHEDRSPSWSPDGSDVAYYASDENGLGDIYVLEIANGQTRQLTNNGENNWMPSWSPDGQHIAYLVNYGGMMMMDANGENAHRLGYGFRPSWSPDSRRIIFYADRDSDMNAEVYDMDLETAVIRNRSQHSSNDMYPAWSPDGRWIAFASARTTNADIYIMPACEDRDLVTCSRDAQPITQNRVADIAPAWSPDSQLIAFTSENEGFEEIFIMDADGSNLGVLTRGSSNNRLPAWRPR